MGSVYERASHGDVVFWVEHAFYFRSGDSEERTCPGICNTMDTCMCNTALSASIAHTMYVQYCLFSSIAHTTVCAILPFPKYPKVSRYPCVARLGTCLSFPRVVCSTTIDLQVLVFGVRANMLAAAPLDPRLYFQFESHKRSNCTPTAAHSTLRVSSCCSSISPRRLGIDVLPLSWYRRSASV